MARARLHRVIAPAPPFILAGINETAFGPRPGGAGNAGGFMPSRERLNEFIAVVEAGDHAGAIERYYTEDSSMQENASPPRVGRDLMVAHERGVLARMSHGSFKAMSSV